MFLIGNIVALASRISRKVPEREHYLMERGRLLECSRTGTPIMRTLLDSPESVGRVVRAARIARGLRQEDLALASGTGRRFIIDLEKGKPNLRLAPTLAVVRALGVRVEATGPDGHA